MSAEKPILIKLGTDKTNKMPTESSEKSENVQEDSSKGRTEKIMTTFYHPKLASLISVLSGFDGFSKTLTMDTPVAQEMLKTFKGQKVVLNYGEFATCYEERIPMTIHNFSITSLEKYQIFGNVWQNRAQYFMRVYNLQLKYPHLFTIEVEWDGIKQLVPAELLLLCLPPQISRVAKHAEESENAKIIKNALSRVRRYHIPKELKTWELLVVEEACPLSSGRNATEILIEEMKSNGMAVTFPEVNAITATELEQTFIRAKSSNAQILVFVADASHYDKIRGLQQEYCIPVQLIGPKDDEDEDELANEINMKIGGLNSIVESAILNNPSNLIIGFDLTDHSDEQKGKLVSIGYSANMLSRHHQFAGGHAYVTKNWDVFSPIVNTVYHKILRIMMKHRGNPSKIVMYFYGITESNCRTINKKVTNYFEHGKLFFVKGVQPNVFVIACSETDEATFSATFEENSDNAESRKWFQISAEDNKIIKYELIFSTQATPPMIELETLTDQLCYDHQIKFKPIGLPIPLQIARRHTDRGNTVLKVNEHGWEEGSTSQRATTDQLADKILDILLKE